MLIFLRKYQWQISGLAAWVTVLVGLTIVDSFSIPQQPKQEVSASSATNTPPESRQDIAAEIVAYYTEVLAWFTGVLAVVSAVEGGLIFWQILLSRAEFVASHRPRIFVQRVRLLERGSKSAKTPAQAHIVLVNGGETSAKIVEWRATIYFQGGNSVYEPHMSPIVIPAPDIHLGTGEYHPLNYAQAPVSDEYSSWKADTEARMFLVGRISYVGPDGIQRNTGFCREYNRNSGMWYIVKESEHEYAY